MGISIHVLFLFLLLKDDCGEERELSMFDQATIVATIHSRWVLNPSYMHTFGITENYFVIIEQPLGVALVTMLACQLKNEPMCTCLKWHENENVSCTFS